MGQLRHIDQSVPPSDASPSEVQQKFLDEYGGHVFKIITDRGAGTGWRAPDGRIVTNHHVIHGSSEILAEQNGKRYRIGKDLQIDDLNDLAVMSFVDQSPPDQRPLRLGKSAVTDGSAVISVGYAGSNKLDGWTGKVEKTIRFDEFRMLGEPFYLQLPLESKSLSDAMDYAKRPLLQLSYISGYGSSGGPVFKEGEVVAVTELGNLRNGFAIPVEKVSDLLAIKPDDSKFIVKSDFENGIQKFVRDWSRNPGSACENSIGPTVTLISAAAFASRSPIAQFMALGPLSFTVGLRTASDWGGLRSSTNQNDSVYYGASLVADGVTAGGTALCIASAFCPKVRPIAIGVTAAGLLARTGCELVPNRFSIQGITRRDGDSRPPFTLNY